jgi:plasmid replication initiation protein
MTSDERDLMRLQKVVKSNLLIQKARYELTAQQYKILNFVISRIKPDDEDFYTQQFTLAELCEVCGISQHRQNLKQVADNIKAIRDLSYWIELNDKYVLFTWFQSAKIDKSRNNLITIKLDEDLKDHLLLLSQFFTSYISGYIYPMKSGYSIHLYEILKSYENLEKYIVDIEDLKQLLQTANYTRYDNFRMRIIEPAIEEINEYTDLKVSFKPIREGRVITKLCFTITPKTSTESAITRLYNYDILEGKIKE